MRIDAMQTKEIFSCQVIDACSTLNAIVPECKGAVSLFHVLTHSLLEYTNIKLSFIGQGVSLSNTLRDVPMSLQNLLTSAEVCALDASQIIASGAPTALANCFTACKKFVSSQPKKAQSRFKQMRIMSVRSKDGR